MDYKDEIEQITKSLKEKRREQKWLAEQSGYCETHVSQVLNAKRKASKRFIVACYGVLGLKFFAENVKYGLHPKAS